MAVPKTSICKKNGFVFGKDKIGCSRHIPDVQSEAKSSHVKRVTKKKFRLCVRTADPRHHSTSNVRRNDVRHGQQQSDVPVG